jgi:hypothetical protein
MQNNSYTDFLNSWDWQWFVTLTFDGTDFTEYRINSLMLTWTRSLCKIEKLQVAYCSVLVIKGSIPHMHLLMTSSSKNGKTLKDVNKRHWERQWFYWAKIEDSKSNYSVSDYLSKNLVRDAGELGFYNKKLLKKLKRVSL